jgi:transcriptional regulator with XRE-family HTH domain
MTEEREPGGAVPDWTLGWRMQRALAHAGISVNDMAADLEVSRTTLSRWLNDRGAPPRSIYLRQWALRCGVDYSWLAGNPHRPGGDYAGLRGSIIRTRWTPPAEYGLAA